MLQEDPAPELPSTHNGCAIARRREGAMLALFSTAWRLGAMGLSSVENHHNLTNAFRSLAEEEGIKRVHARDLEMHMKSKKQLYTCLTLEGKQPTTHMLLLCHSLTSDPL
jgi:hypothetical protein